MDNEDDVKMTHEDIIIKTNTLTEMVRDFGGKHGKV
jgi:hypothetical protein